MKELQAEVVNLEKENYNLRMKLKAYEDAQGQKSVTTNPPIFGF